MRPRPFTRLVVIAAVAALGLVACGRTLSDVLGTPDATASSDTSVLASPVPSPADDPFDPDRDRVVQVIERSCRPW